jgi:hypothetical protein
LDEEMKNVKEGKVPALKLYLKGISEEVKALNFLKIGNKLDLHLGRTADRHNRALSESRGRSLKKNQSKIMPLFSTPVKFPNNPFYTLSKEPGSLKKSPRLARGAKRDKSITPPEDIHTDVKRPNKDVTLCSDIGLNIKDISDSILDDNYDPDIVFGVVKLNE